MAEPEAARARLRDQDAALHGRAERVAQGAVGQLRPDVGQAFPAAPDAEDLVALLGGPVRDRVPIAHMVGIMEWDEAQHFPRDVFRKLGELGFLGTIFPEKYGGAGLSYMDYIGVIEEIAAVDGSVGLSLAAHTSLGTNHIFQFGTEEQRQRYIPKLAGGEWLAAWGLTEAEAGSDSGYDQSQGGQETQERGEHHGQKSDLGADPDGLTPARRAEEALVPAQRQIGRRKAQIVRAAERHDDDDHHRRDQEQEHGAGQRQDRC